MIQLLLQTNKFPAMRMPTILFLFLCSTLLGAQDLLLFEDTKTETLVFSETNIGYSSTTLKQLLQVLNPQNGYHASFDLYYEYGCRLVEKSNYLEGKLKFDALEISHDPQVRGFYFTDLLYPVSAWVTFDLLADDEVVHSMNENIPLTNLNQAVLSFNFNDIQAGIYYTLAIKNLKFNYTDTQVKMADRRKNAINEYYQAKEDFNEIQKALSSLEDYQADPDHIDELERDINNWSTQFDKIDKASFWTILPLNSATANDPEQLVALKNEVGNNLDSAQEWIKDLKANIHELYYQKGLDFFNNRQIGDAKRAFEKSIHASRHYAPSHHFLAIIDFNEGRIDESADRIRKVLNDFHPDPQTRQASEELARDIIRFHFDAGQKAVDVGDYPAAVDIYQHALAFSESIRGFHFGQNEAKSHILEAYHQDFHSRLDEVVYLKRQGNLEQALILIEDALAFQAEFQIPSTYNTYDLHGDIVKEIFENKLKVIDDFYKKQSWDEAITAIQNTEYFIADYPEFLKSQRLFNTLKNKVFTGKYQNLAQLADVSRKNGKLDQALEEATQAFSFAKAYNLSITILNESEQQIQSIQKARYQRFVQGGNKARQQQHFQDALNQYDAAQDLEKSLSYLPTSLELDQKTKGTALQEIKRLYQEVMQQSADNNQQIATVFRHIQDLSGRYHLTLEPEVKDIYQELENQQCLNANQVLMPALEKDLAHFQAIKDFPNAREIIDDIKTLLDTYPDCGLSDAVIQNQAAGIEICAQYQETLDDAEAAEKQHRYRAALDHYLRAKELYRNPLVANQLAAHAAFKMYDYILNYTDSNMLMAGANLYLDQRKHDESLSLLKAIIASGIPPKRTENLQERLGSALAVRYFVESANWKVVFGTFVSKNERKKYKDMKQSFRRQWRRMG